MQREGGRESALPEAWEWRGQLRQLFTLHLVKCQDGGGGVPEAPPPLPPTGRPQLQHFRSTPVPGGLRLAGPGAGGGGCRHQRKPAVGTRQVGGGGGGGPRLGQTSPSPRALFAQASGMQVGSVPRSQLTSRTGERVYQRFLKRGQAWRGVLEAHPESQGGPPLRQGERKTQLLPHACPGLPSLPLTDCFCSWAPVRGSLLSAQGPDIPALTSGAPTAGPSRLPCSPSVRRPRCLGACHQLWPR